MPKPPLPVGTRVWHINQQWARSATAEITAVMGPYNDGSYEYMVLAGENFARQLGPDNPMTRVAQWSSFAVEEPSS